MKDCNVNQDFHLSKHKLRPHENMRSLLIFYLNSIISPQLFLKI